MDLKLKCWSLEAPPEDVGGGAEGPRLEVDVALSLLLLPVGLPDLCQVAQLEPRRGHQGEGNYRPSVLKGSQNDP